MATPRYSREASPAPGGGRHRVRYNLCLAGLFAAITGCFLVYSLIQERLMTLGFGPEHERFQHSLFIILVNRLVACAVAAAALGLAGKSLQPTAPLALFSIPSIANVLGSASQYEALKYVSFPLQALAKCAKTVPVMAWGLVLGGRKYAAIDYACAATVTVGCAIFMLTGSIAAPQQLSTAVHSAAAAGAGASSSLATAVSDSSGGSAEAGVLDAAAAAAGGLDSGEWLLYGLLLLAAFLLFDGLTSTTQDKLFAAYDMHSCNQLLWVSAWSAAVSCVLLLAGNQLLPALLFVARHPSALAYILLLSAVSTAVQLFIFYTIQQYGALHFALIMTIRQFLSIVLSCLVFNHSLTAAQWVGTLLVIGGLVARGMLRGGGHPRGAAKPAAKRAGGVMRKSSSMRSAAALLLPLATVPVVDQAAGQLLAASAAVEAHGVTGASIAAAAAKKFGASIPLEVQAGGLAHATASSAAAAASSAEGARLAMRRGTPWLQPARWGGWLTPRAGATEVA